MKLTWFGGTALRAYVGGEIVVVDPDAAPADVDRGELLGGADHVLDLAAGNAQLIDADAWRPATARPLEAPPAMQILSLGPSTLVISAAGEPPLLIADVVELPHLGRWADGAVFVLFGERGARLAEAIAALDLAGPRLLAIAATEEIVDSVFDTYEHMNQYPNVPNLSSLEPGLALEV
jgi:hypothetical protein